MGMEVGVASEVVAVEGKAGRRRGGSQDKQAETRRDSVQQKGRIACVSVFVQSSCNNVQ